MQPVPVLSTEEPDLSHVLTHQGRGLAVWGSVFELHRGSGGVENFYLMDNNNQTKVPAGLSGKKGQGALRAEGCCVYVTHDCLPARDPEWQGEFGNVTLGDPASASSSTLFSSQQLPVSLCPCFFRCFGVSQ